MTQIPCLVGVTCLAGLVRAHQFDSDTVAFYPFNEGVAGADASGTTVRNLIDPNLCPGTFNQTGSSGSVTFSDECPGEYLFGDIAYTNEWLYAHPKSIYFTSTDARGFQLVLEGLSTLAVTNEGYTIEFYYKLDSGCPTSWQGLVKHYLGWDRLGPDSTTVTHTNVYLLTDLTELGSETSQALRYFQWFGYNLSRERDADLISQIYWRYPENGGHAGDGKWHYCAISYPFGVYDYLQAMHDRYFSTQGGHRIAFYADVAHAKPNYRRVESMPERPVVFNNGRNFKGWISCVRVSKRRRDQVGGGLLQASDLATCVPRTIARYRLEGDVGASVPAVIANDAPSFASVNARQFRLPTTPEVPSWANGDVTGNATRYLPAGASATYDGDRKKAFALEGGLQDAAVRNQTSVALVPAAAAATGYAEGAAVGLPPGTRPPFGEGDNYTFEFFVKFDRELWKRRIGDVTEERKVISLAWLSYSNTGVDDFLSRAWHVYLDLTDENAPLLGMSGGTTAEAAALLDGKWHHLAIVNGMTGNGALYLDYLPKARFSTFGVVGYRNYRTFWIGRHNDGRNQQSALEGGCHAFPGKIDEVRLTYGRLDPADFLRQASLDGALFLVR